MGLFIPLQAWLHQLRGPSPAERAESNDDSSQTFRCMECFNEIAGSVESLSRCPRCNSYSWEALRGQEAA